MRNHPVRQPGQTARHFISTLTGRARPAVAALLCCAAGGAFAQGAWPTKAVRILTAEVGGNNDWIARITAQELTKTLGQPVVVENRGGLAPELVARGAPDGHMLLFYGGAAWLAPYLHPVAYDPLRDLAPVTLVITSPNVLVVHPSLPVKSVRDLIQLARINPGKLNYGAGTIGAVPHLGMELLKNMAGVDIVRIAYKGTPSSVLGVVGGQVHVAIAGLGSVDAYLKANKLRPLATGDPKPSALLPGLPTIGATLPGYEVVTRIAMFAPGGTPAAVVARLNREMVRMLSMPELKEKILASGGEAAAGTPEDLAAIVKNEMSKWGRIIKDAGLRGE